MTTAITDLFDAKPDLVRCPHLAYTPMRDQPPMWIERLRAFAVTRYDEVMTVLRDTDRFSAEFASGPGSVTPLARRLVEDPDVSDSLKAKALRRIEISRSLVLLNADPPEHGRQRRLVNKAFTARRVAAMESSVEKIAVDLFDRFAASGRAELVSQFALPLPMTVISGMLGVPAELFLTFKKWSDAFVAGVGSSTLSHDQIDALFSAVDEFYDYFTEQIAVRTENPTDDLLSALVTARVGGERPLELNEMLQMIVLFLVGGNETTTNLLTSTMYTLLTTPELMADVRADPARIPAVIEEVLRTESPIQGLFRSAKEDVEIGGTAIPAGSMIYVVYAAANRDDAMFPDAAQICPGRPEAGQHVAFGKGEHFCLGATLARLEARVGIATWLSRTSEIALDTPDEIPPYLPSFVLHGIRNLPVRFTLR